MNKKRKPDVPWWRPGLELFWKLSGWIAFPVIAAVVIGKYLDRRFHSEPWIFLLSVGIAFFVSMVALVYYGVKEMRKIENESKKSEVRKH